MFPLTNAAGLPNIGRAVTAGSSGTSFANAAALSPLGLGIDPRAAGLTTRTAAPERACAGAGDTQIRYQSS